MKAFLIIGAGALAFATVCGIGLFCSAAGGAAWGTAEAGIYAVITAFFAACAALAGGALTCDAMNRRRP